MPTVFVDTAAWIALLNTSDVYHDRASGVMIDLRRQHTRLVTTEFILLEVGDALSARDLRSKTVAFIAGLRRTPVLEVVPASPSLLDGGWQLYAARRDKDWGLTDCTSFSLMQQRGIVKAFTSDHHFTQAGFQKLL